MFKKKLLIVMLLILSLVVSAVGCTQQQQPAQEEPKAEEKAETKVEELGYAHPESLISAQELKEIMDDENVKILGVEVKDYIPGSVKIKEEDFNYAADGLKNVRPTKEQWEKVLSNVGIDNDDTIVLYDAKNMLLSARVWWILKYYNHEDVKILNGGIKAWENAGYETASSPAEKEAATYEIKGENPEILATVETVKTSFDNDKIATVDTRSDKEWNKGRVPGAVHIEWTNALKEDGTFKSADELKALYEENGITADKEIITYCLGGWRAAHSMFALTELLGYENVKNYDGSWEDYEKSGEPIEK